MTKPVQRPHRKTGRKPDQFSEEGLRGALRGSSGGFPIEAVRLTSTDVARWLGQAPQTVTRWRREADFPDPAGTLELAGKVGSPWVYYWLPEDVLSWLRARGRLV
jgi:hypothetical protein